MCSDADPAVAVDPKQQHMELTNPGIYSGIPAVFSPLSKQTIRIDPIFMGKHTLATEKEKKPPKLHQSVLEM